MIWLFKVDEVFNGNEPKVNAHYWFDSDDINFDITKYDITLYMATANYYILSDADPDKIYYLDYNGVNSNPIRRPVLRNFNIFNIIKDFYITEMRNNKLKNLGL